MSEPLCKCGHYAPEHDGPLDDGECLGNDLACPCMKFDPMTTPTTGAREREALTVLDEVLRGRRPHNHPDAKQALAAVRAELTEVRLWIADANAQVTFYAKECATLRAALEYKGEALDAYRTAILAAERARVRAVVEGEIGRDHDGCGQLLHDTTAPDAYLYRADLLARLDAEPTP